MISYGVSGIVNEKLCLLSDAYTAFVCEKCGLFCMPKDNGKGLCRSCKKSGTGKIQIPYSYHLLSDELFAMGIVMRLELEEGDTHISDNLDMKQKERNIYVEEFQNTTQNTRRRPKAETTKSPNVQNRSIIELNFDAPVVESKAPTFL